MKKARFKKTFRNVMYLLAYAIDVFLLGIEIAVIILWIQTGFNTIKL